MATQRQQGQLRGLKVVEFAHLAAGPPASSVLAGQGADAVHVEPPGQGDATRDGADPERGAAVVQGGGAEQAIGHPGPARRGRPGGGAPDQPRGGAAADLRVRGDLVAAGRAGSARGRPGAVWCT
ncbi:CoA transferase [Nonomuraea rhizosphaerae]|uniref:CoA transferase n=1 Tax=Nonomuraea rhizosphaerae TaxID=2665663 RepID=UPI001C5E078D